MLKKCILITSIFIFNINILFSQNENVEYEIIADDLFSPWEITEGPDGWLWYTERIGTISRLNTESGEIIQLVKVDSVWNEWERGLLGMAIHPDFDEKPYVYTVYTTRIGENEDDFENRLIRYEYNQENDTLINYKKLLVTNGASIHNGSRLKFGPDGYLYMTMGDTRNWDLSPDLNKLEGKILRMDDEGNPLESNPYYGEGNKNTDYIYSYAHRNPQGLVFVGDRLFSSEHGPKTDDEINEIIKGRNYGWPKVLGYCNEDDEDEMYYCNEWNVRQPLYASIETPAFSGLDFYDGNLYDDWNNSFFVATLDTGSLNRIKMNNELTEIIDYSVYFLDDFTRIRDIVIPSNDSIYFVTCEMDWEFDVEEKGNDKLIKIIQKATNIELDVEQESIIVYPNPVKYIAKLNSDKLIKSIELFNPIGQSVYKKDNLNSYNESIEISAYQSGSYILVIGLDENRFVNKKIIIE